MAVGKSAGRDKRLEAQVGVWRGLGRSLAFEVGACSWCLRLVLVAFTSGGAGGGCFYEMVVIVAAVALTSCSFVAACHFCGVYFNCSVFTCFT